jgi:hypothetical protein
MKTKIVKISEAMSTSSSYFVLVNGVITEVLSPRGMSLKHAIENYHEERLNRFEDTVLSEERTLLVKQAFKVRELYQNIRQYSVPNILIAIQCELARYVKGVRMDDDEVSAILDEYAELQKFASRMKEIFPETPVVKYLNLEDEVEVEDTGPANSFVGIFADKYKKHTGRRMSLRNRVIVYVTRMYGTAPGDTEPFSKEDIIENIEQKLGGSFSPAYVSTELNALARIGKLKKVGKQFEITEVGVEYANSQLRQVGEK